MTAERDQDILARVQADPEFTTLVERRHKLAWSLSALMLAIYFGFILMIAFAPALLGTPIGDGVTTIGIPIGVLVILAAFLLTGIYVYRANATFDPTMEKIVERAKS
jgi:uncharacterized membrane protein (DUF485 family)